MGRVSPRRAQDTNNPTITPTSSGGLLSEPVVVLPDIRRNPHHQAGERVIERGDMVVLDFGGLKRGYGSDTSRTVHVGEPTDEERTVHDLVRTAQEAGFRAVRPGAACQDVDRAARAVIEQHP